MSVIAAWTGVGLVFISHKDTPRIGYGNGTKDLKDMYVFERTLGMPLR